jgi:hypothetical protein
MSKPVQLTENQWEKIRQHTAEHYPPSVLLIRDCMRRDLGFTTRVHRDYRTYQDYDAPIMLDFYDDPKRTMFLLKYSEYLQQERYD